ncbi:MAG: baseplate J/gp47 family protein [Chloroflexota bacterium]
MSALSSTGNHSPSRAQSLWPFLYNSESTDRPPMAELFPGPVQVIYLDANDDLATISGRLQWIQAGRVVLVLPPGGTLLTEWLDLVRLRRQADELGLEVGLVTADPLVITQARRLGFPVFLTVAASQNGRWAWRRWRKRKAAYPAEATGPGRPLDAADRQAIYRRLTPRPLWQRWLRRYAAILFFFLTLSLLSVAAVYILPVATIVLKPAVTPVQVNLSIVADPQLETVNFSGASVPGRRLAVTEEWRATVATTGATEIPEGPARGVVVFANRLPQAVTVTAGTRVRTSSGRPVVFQTLEPIEVPASIGATAEAEVVAIEPGPAGNVEATLVNQIEGSLALQLAVRNLEPMEGGAARVVPAVTSADQERLRQHVLDQLRALAIAEMQASLNPGEFLAQDSVQVATIYHETFTHFVGEPANQLTLEVRAEWRGTAVDQAQTIDLVRTELLKGVPPGFHLLTDSLTLRSGEVLGVDGEGRVSFMMMGEGVAAAELELAAPIQAITGQPVDSALAYLSQQLPLREYPAAELWPGWFGRLPYLSSRIRVHTET